MLSLSEPKRSNTPSEKCENIEEEGSSSRAEIQNQDEYRKLYLGKGIIIYYFSF